MTPLTATPLHELLPYRIAAAAVGPNGHLTPPHLIRLFQEAAMRNTVRLGISSPELMAAYDLSWVLRRQRITVDHWPLMGRSGSILTAPTGFARGLLTYRDFHLRDESGTQLASSSSEWLLMKVSSRRLQPIPPSIARLEQNLAPASAHLKRPAGKLLPPAGVGLRERTFTVAYHQLDFNDHLTNPVYPELMLEPLGHAFLSAHEPVLLDVAYHHEARYGETVTARTAPGPNPAAGTLAYAHELRKANQSLATMVSHWRKTAPLKDVL